MNQIQYWTLTALAVLIFILLSVHIYLVRLTNGYQNVASAAQIEINKGQASKQIAEQVAKLISDNAGKSQALKELAARQSISLNTNATENPAAPAGTTH